MHAAKWLSPPELVTAGEGSDQSAADRRSLHIFWHYDVGFCRCDHPVGSSLDEGCRFAVCGYLAHVCIQVGTIKRVRIRKSLLQQVKDFVLAPLRLILLPDDLSTTLGLTSLEKERINAVLPHIEGQLLDIGAGRNTLVKAYGNGMGVDIHEWGGGALIVQDSSRLPFADHEFDTITFLACLNHIPNRAAVLLEANRLLKDDGRLLITMIDPIIGGIGHRVWWYSEDKQRGMAPGEVYGMWNSEIHSLCENAGFTIVKHERFVYGLNNLYVARKLYRGEKSQA